jgi:hypothetical protein
MAFAPSELNEIKMSLFGEMYKRRPGVLAPSAT